MARPYPPHPKNWQRKYNRALLGSFELLTNIDSEINVLEIRQSPYSKMRNGKKICQKVNCNCKHKDFIREK
jgi:hypothetical protein